MISGQRCLVLGRVTQAGEFLKLSGEGLRSLIAELNEIFRRAFILRRLELIERYNILTTEDVVDAMCQLEGTKPMRKNLTQRSESSVRPRRRKALNPA